MKTKVFPFIVAGLVSIVSCSILSAQNTSEFYKNIEDNLSTNSKTVTIYLGEAGMNLVPKARHIVKYDSNELPIEKTIYSWSSAKQQWEASKKYTYTYNENKKMESLSYTKWNNKTNTWENNTHYAMYLYNTEGALLTAEK